MTADKEYIEYLRKRYKMTIPEDLEAYLLEEYSEEPFPYEYTEQDLYEQIRKLVKKYHEGLLDVTLKGPELRLKQQYDALKDEYIDAMFKMRGLEDEVAKLKTMLMERGVDLLSSELF